MQKMRSLLGGVTCMVLCVCSAYGQTITTVIPSTTVFNGDVSDHNSPVLQFSLNIIPADAVVDSCFLRLTLKKKGGGAKMYIEEVTPVDSAAQIEELTIYDDVDKDTYIPIQRLPISSLLINSKLKNIFQLKLVAKDGDDVYIWDTAGKIGDLPRLMVKYHRKGSSDVAWASFRGDQQHTARSRYAFVGSMPQGFNRVQSTRELGHIQNNLVMYKNNIYVVEKNINNRNSLLAFDPMTLQSIILANDLAPAKVMPAIDNKGILYYATETMIITFDLVSGKRDTSSIPKNGKTLTKPMTIGADGTVYMVQSDNMSTKIYAYSPYPQNRILWWGDYDIVGEQYSDKSSVALNMEGTIAYVCTHSRLLAINTENGRLLASAAIAIRKNTDPLPAPAVSNDGHVYIAADAIIADHPDTLHIFDGLLRQDTRRKYIGRQLTQPVCGVNDTVFFTANDSLYISTRSGFNTLCALNKGQVVSMVADASNNVFVSCDDGRNSKLISCVAKEQGGGYVVQEEPEVCKGLQGETVIAPDGALYGMTSSKLVKISAKTFTGDFTFSKQDVEYNNTTFRGNTVTVPDNMVLKHRKIFVAARQLKIGKNVAIPQEEEIVMESGGSISFKPGFSVKKGAMLSCRLANR